MPRNLTGFDFSHLPPTKHFLSIELLGDIDVCHVHVRYIDEHRSALLHAIKWPVLRKHSLDS